MFPRSLTQVALSALCLILVSACGGGGSSTPPTQPPPASPIPPPTVINAPDLTQEKLLSDAEMETTAIEPAPAVAPEILNWMSQNHRPIRSITYDRDFSDLAFLKEQIGNRSIVQLGESSHGTAEFNHVKTRLVKYLHQELGFSVIAIESGFFDGLYADSIRETDTATSLMRFIFGVWNTEEVLELFEYVQETQSGPNPLRLIGFDVQISSSYFPRVESYINNIPSTNIMTDAFKAELVRDLLQYNSLQNEFNDQRCYQATSTACQTALDTMDVVKTRLQNLEQRILAIANPDKDIRALSIILFAAAGQIDYNTTYYIRGNSDNVRDLNMATIVNRIRDDLYPGKKMVIWAHNRHIAHERSPAEASVNAYRPIDEPMGYHLKKEHGDDLYSIALYMLRGETADNSRNTLQVLTPRDHSIEAIAHSVRKAALFIDSQSQQT